MTKEKLKYEIERYMDANNLNETLYLVEEVCMEKADHINETWQDEQLATKWVSASNAINESRGRINSLHL